MAVKQERFELETKTAYSSRPILADVQKDYYY